MSLLSTVADFLSCPICNTNLSEKDKTLKCSMNHSFDQARQGYISLFSKPSKHKGDLAEMVKARSNFLEKGHFHPLYESLKKNIAPTTKLIVDLGAGTGNLLSHLLTPLPDCYGLALDLSVYACKRAQKKHERLQSICCDFDQGIPVKTNISDCVISSFAPRPLEEIRRLISPGGIFIVVTPGNEHMQALRKKLKLLGIEKDKLSRIDESVENKFNLVLREKISFRMDLSKNECLNLVAMGPNAWHQKKEKLSANLQESSFNVGADFVVSYYQPKLEH